MLNKIFLAVIFSSFYICSTICIAQVHNRGVILIDAYYGWPNLVNNILNRTYVASGAYQNARLTSMGPLGTRIEYLISKRIGIGLNVNYANTKVIGETVDGNTNSGSEIRNKFEINVIRLRVFPTLNIHMGSSDKLDPYFAFGLGYTNFDVDVSTNSSTLPPVENIIRATIPFAARAEFGLRYFFSDYVGSHIQAGLGGGPLLAAGLSFRF